MVKKLLTTGTVLAGCGFLVLTGQVPARGAMPVPQQNVLVHKYCVPCHDDAKMTGGLTLQHFDAAQADPSIAAMLLSKLTNGLPLERVSAANTDSTAAAAIDIEMKSSAIHAAGVPAPDVETSRAWVLALSAEAARAADWTVSASQTQGLTASIIREATAANDPAKTDMYRLKVTCHADTREGEMRLAWAPGGPKPDQELSVVVDGGEPISNKVGPVQGKAAPGDMMLNVIPLPQQTLSLGNLVDGERVVFSFSDLPQTARRVLSTCFEGTGTGQ